MIVVDYTHKKVCKYLDTGRYKKVLLIFSHGLGDAVMFYSTCLQALRKAYPGVEFTFGTHLGQEELFGEYDRDHRHYDIAFNIVYPCSEWGRIEETKSEKCARVELGLPMPLEEHYGLPKKYPSPLVGVHFNSTCIPRMNVPPEYGMKLWEQVQEAGLIPIDTHMRHATDNKASVVHDYEQCRRVDNVPATIDKLVGLLSVLRGFAGVPSGNICCAWALLPPRKILFLSSEFPLKRQVHLECHEVNIRKPYDAGAVKAWLDDVKAD